MASSSTAKSINKSQRKNSIPESPHYQPRTYHIHELQVWICSLKLSDPPHRACPNHAPLGQGGEGQPLVLLRHNDGVPGVLPLKDSAKGHTLWQVLERVDDEIDAAVGEGDLEILGEERLLADLGEGQVQHAVAQG
ncbi:hypothetical protein BC938DRAFT_481683 [Jimgerdemannia flammicorona]|uniref:Uncharacterized protein n=1 Tax=Jimgerdemannia flammicorona TaxID=994334 RepID=A0A433QWV0_9FUNG|nr:hypothetical protein BC938DRAFT_481683 [Jimgerdemannia flammicorona]